MSSSPEFSLAPDNTFEVTKKVKEAFDEWGYIIVRNLLTSDEVDKLRKTLEEDKNFRSHAFGRSDDTGLPVKVCLWNHLGKDVTGVIARSEKMATTFEKLIGGPVYHFHSKVIMKDAYEGGSHVWHQDYGYWYNNDFLWPTMGTVFIPVDRATKENGCLRIIPKSHLFGRIDHVKVNGQVGADMTRVNEIINVLGEEQAVEMDAGDALFFHSNILHTSAQNHSPNRRWAFLVAYNRVDNPPVGQTREEPIGKMPNSEILRCKSMAATNPEMKDFFDGGDFDASMQINHEST